MIQTADFGRTLFSGMHLCTFLSSCLFIVAYRPQTCFNQEFPLFAAFDHPHYQKFIPQYLKDVVLMPPSVKRCFESVAFVCSISGKQIRSVALDEAHEMLFNKDLNTTIKRPTEEYLERILYYYPVRALALKN